MSNLGLAHCLNLFRRLRGTVTGANNRLDLLSLVTCGVDENEMSSGAEVLDVTEGWEEDETHNPDIPATSHRRGMAAFVFVPFEEVCLSLILVNGRSDYMVGSSFSSCLRSSLDTFCLFRKVLQSILWIKNCLWTHQTYVKWMQVETSVLNLPVDKMDYYVPGWGFCSCIRWC
jgi:hypothetical protein